MSTAAQQHPVTGPVQVPGLARTGAASFLLVMIGSGLAFSTTLLAGNLLGAGGTGMFFQMTACFAILTTVCTLGSDTGLVRFLSASRALGRLRDGPALLRTALIPVAAVSGTVALVLWAIAPQLQDSLQLGPEAAASIRLAAPFLVAGAVMTVLFGALRGSRQVVRFAVLQNLILPVLRLTALGAAIVAGARMQLLTAAWVLPVLALCAFAALSLRRTLAPAPAVAGAIPTRAGPSRPLPSRREFWSFSGARGVSAAIEVLLEWIGVLAAAIWLGPVAAGVFAVVTRCLRLGMMLDHTARIVSGPALSEALAVGDNAAAGRLFRSTTQLLILGAWPLYLVFVVFGEPLLRLFGPGFDAGAPVFALSAAAMLLVVSAGGVQSLLLMSGRSRWQLFNKTAALLTAIGLNLVLTPVLGLPGVMVAWAGAALVDVGLAALQVRIFLRIRTRLSDVALPAGLAFSVFGIGGALVRLAAGQTLTGLIILLLAGGATYAGALILLRRRLRLDVLASKPHLPRSAESDLLPGS